MKILLLLSSCFISARSRTPTYAHSMPKENRPDKSFWIHQANETVIKAIAETGYWPEVVKIDVPVGEATMKAYFGPTDQINKRFGWGRPYNTSKYAPHSISKNFWKWEAEDSDEAEANADNFFGINREKVEPHTGTVVDWSQAGEEMLRIRQMDDPWTYQNEINEWTENLAQMARDTKATTGVAEWEDVAVDVAVKDVGGYTSAEAVGIAAKATAEKVAADKDKWLEVAEKWAEIPPPIVKKPKAKGKEWPEEEPMPAYPVFTTTTEDPYEVEFTPIYPPKFIPHYAGLDEKDQHGWDDPNNPGKVTREDPNKGAYLLPTKELDVVQFSPEEEARRRAAGIILEFPEWDPKNPTGKFKLDAYFKHNLSIPGMALISLCAISGILFTALLHIPTRQYLRDILFDSDSNENEEPLLHYWS